MSKFNIGLKSLLPKDLSESQFYGDLGYKMKKTVGSYKFLAQLKKLFLIIRRLTVATYCMLGGQPKHDWQLCFPL